MYYLTLSTLLLLILSLTHGFYLNRLPITTEANKLLLRNHNIQMCNSNTESNSNTPLTSTTIEKKEDEIKTNNIFKRIFSSFKNSKESSSSSKKGPNFKELGLYALLSYGFVSNFSYVTTVICAWVIHGKTSGLSPLAEGQWKQFGAIYLSIYAVNNLLRPLRMSVAVALAPAFDKMILSLQNKFNIGKSKATGLLVFLVNVLGTFSYLFFGLAVVTKIAGVPLLA